MEPDKDIPIVISGKRAGEKLFEEPLTAEEGTTVTRLRQDAPWGITGRNGERRPRRTPQGEVGLASAQFRLALPRKPRAEARKASLMFDIPRKAIQDLKGLIRWSSFDSMPIITILHLALY